VVRELDRGRRVKLQVVAGGRMVEGGNAGECAH